MDRINELFAGLGRALGQLTPRERLLVSLAGVSVVVFVASITWTSLSSSIGRKEASIEEKALMLQQVAAYAQTYQESEAARRQMEMRLGSEPVRLSSHVESVATANQVTIPTLSDLGEKQLEGVRESLVEIRLPKIGLNELNALLNNLEKSQRVVRIRKVRMRRDPADPKMLNVTVVVGSYWLSKAG